MPAFKNSGDLDSAALNFTSKISMNVNPFMASAKTVEDKLDNIQKLLIATGTHVDKLGDSFSLNMGKAKNAVSGLSGGMSSLAGVITSIPGLVIGAVGSLVGFMGPAYEMDNFMSTLNQNINNTYGSLERYRNFINEQTKGAKEGDLDFGATRSERMATAQHFVQSQDNAIKYGAGAQQAYKDFSTASLGFSRNLGVDLNSSSEMFINIQRSIGMSTAEMPKFSSGLIDIARNSKLSGTSIANLLSVVTVLGTNLRLTGQEFVDFANKSVMTGSILASVGLGADTQEKMMSFQKKGGIEGFLELAVQGVTSADLADPTVMLQKKADMAKKISDMAGSDPMMRLAMMPSIAASLHQNMSIEEITKLAPLAGTANLASLAEAGKSPVDKKMDDIYAGLKEAGDRYVTSADRFHAAVAKGEVLLDETFRQSVLEFGKMVTTFSDNITKWFEKLKEWFPNGISLVGVVTGAIGLALAPSVIKGLFSTVMGLAGSTGPGAGAALSGAAGGVVGIVGSVLAVLGAGVAGYQLGKMIDAWTDDVPWMKAVKQKTFDWIVGGKNTSHTEEEMFGKGSNKTKYSGLSNEELQSLRTKKWGPATNSFADAVTHHEGADVKGSLAQRFNNPGNIRVPGWDRGLSPEEAMKRAKAYGAQDYDPSTGFLKFASKEEGMNKVNWQFSKYARENPDMTVSQAINKYAPKSDNNDVKAYLSDLSSKGFTPDMKLSEALKITKPGTQAPESIASSSKVEESKAKAESTEKGHSYLAQIADNTSLMTQGILDLANKLVEWKVPTMAPAYSNPYPVDPFRINR